MAAPVVVVDVAHPPRHPDRIEEDLLDAWQRVRNAGRVLKIIHGHGSSGRGGSTRDIVRNWLYRNRSRFRSVIDGERYSISDPETMRLRREVGAYPDRDLDAGNPGITVVWVR